MCDTISESYNIPLTLSSPCSGVERGSALLLHAWVRGQGTSSAPLADVSTTSNINTNNTLLTTQLQVMGLGDLSATLQSYAPQDGESRHLQMDGLLDLVQSLKATVERCVRLSHYHH